MTDEHSTTSSAEVEGYVAPSSTDQTVQFAPVVDHVQTDSVSSPGSRTGGSAGNPEKYSKWSAHDDILLCDALIAQKQKGRCRDAGVFSMSAWNEVSEAMKGSELITGGAQKNVVQCKARWQRLKIEYRIVKLLRNAPGFSWDESTHMVKASPNTWEAYAVEHRDCIPWRKKAFPPYDRVTFLVENEEGKDMGEERFKRRWNSASQSSSTPGPPESRASSTSVFSIKRTAPQSTETPDIRFATSVVPGVTMTIPLNGGNSSVHQYRFSVNEPNGKRAQSPPAEQSASTAAKRPKSATVVPSQGPTETYAYPPHPHSYPYMPPPMPNGPTWAPPPPPPAPVPTPASRLALAIQTMEDTEGLSDEDLVKAIQLFQRHIEVPDAYLAIQSKRARSLYLRAEINDFPRSE